MQALYYPAILYLEDGKYFKGWSFNSKWFSMGEVVFNTGMTGYQEIMTDPSYANQIIVFTYPEIGNTGVNLYDCESKSIYIKGIVSKNLCDLPSNWRSNSSLKAYILDFNIPHIFGIDTRALTKHLRKYGVMNGCISSKILSLIKIKDLLVLKYLHISRKVDLIHSVTTKEIYNWTSKYDSIKYDCYMNNIISDNKKLFNITVVDFGVKHNILLRLSVYGCKVTILPAYSTIYEVLKSKPDGILLSNGPGDPSDIIYAHRVIKQLIDFTNIPIFGICMGHQLLSSAIGGSTFKLKFGHRGLNHPSGIQQNVEVTSQNHGFAVNIDAINSSNITHKNLNDLTIAGIRYLNKPIFSVQYHPEASPGPHDSDYLFDTFIKLIVEIKDYIKDV